MKGFGEEKDEAGNHKGKRGPGGGCPGGAEAHYGRPISAGLGHDGEI